LCGRRSLLPLLASFRSHLPLLSRWYLFFLPVLPSPSFDCSSYFLTILSPHPKINASNSPIERKAARRMKVTMMLVCPWPSCCIHSDLKRGIRGGGERMRQQHVGAFYPLPFLPIDASVLSPHEHRVPIYVSSPLALAFIVKSSVSWSLLPG
jgi:hypothetical protein